MVLFESIMYEAVIKETYTVNSCPQRWSEFMPGNDVRLFSLRNYSTCCAKTYKANFRLERLRSSIKKDRRNADPFS